MGVSTYSKPFIRGKELTELPPDDRAKIKACHILVKHRDSARPVGRMARTVTRSREEALDLIQHYREDIKSGQRGFQDVASEFSDCSSSADGGDLGWFKEGQMQPLFEAAAFSLKVGEMGDPIWTESGVHLILRTG